MPPGQKSIDFSDLDPDYEADDYADYENPAPPAGLYTLHTQLTRMPRKRLVLTL
jgi:hypothetical protein